MKKETDLSEPFRRLFAPRRVVEPALRGPLTRVLAQAMLGVVVRVGREDLPIWNHKRYEPRPRLTRGDEAITHYRRWARQFYPPDRPD
ncbi:hypothetical protein [Embleya sp. NBC_00896]|uniref:hypothetical protein n=1 Tax=Embleya sp. NBC_00896 TaxID=2975961 RepID=UPI002F90C6C9|nr:hypothetical protein OG928_36260 [Embleya sp. NBC_00896]